MICARHAKWDERPVLIVAAASDQAPTEEELVAFFKDKVPTWQIPDRGIVVEALPLGALPLGATGKVLKRKLREEYGAILIEA